MKHRISIYSQEDELNFDNDLNIVSVLESNEKFIINLYNSNELLNPPHLALYFNRGDEYPTLVDESHRLGNEQVIEGTCRLDVPKKRVIYDPYSGSGKWRESVQALGGLDLLYDGVLYDVLQELIQNGYNIMQVTSLDNAEIIKDKKGRSDFTKFRLTQRAKEEFGRITGKYPQEAFQIEKEISLDDVLNKNFKKPTLVDETFEKYVSRISRTW